MGTHMNYLTKVSVLCISRKSLLLGANTSFFICNQKRGFWDIFLIFSQKHIVGKTFLSTTTYVLKRKEKFEKGKCPKILYTNVSEKMGYVNSVDPEQTTSSGAV